MHNIQHKLILMLLFLLTACASGVSEPLPTATTQAVAILPTTASTAAAPPTQTAIPTVTATNLPPTAVPPTATPPPTETPLPTETPPPTAVPYGGAFTIGSSTQDIPIEAYKFGNGPINIIFVGGIHGGYEWNTILLAYEAIDYYTNNREAVPPSVTLYIIPVLNPDGQYTVTFQTGRFTPDQVPANTDTDWGRFNGNGVDLNRNWDCEWQPSATWKNLVVSAGSEPMSEPESAAFRDFVLPLDPAAVVFWHSSAPGVFPAGCGNIYQESADLARLYANGSNGYPYISNFTAYYVTGDVADWLATQDIPAITVEFRNHINIDWELNLGGMTAVLEQYR